MTSMDFEPTTSPLVRGRSRSSALDMSRQYQSLIGEPFSAEEQANESTTSNDQDASQMASQHLVRTSAYLHQDYHEDNAITQDRLSKSLIDVAGASVPEIPQRNERRLSQPLLQAPYVAAISHDHSRSTSAEGASRQSSSSTIIRDFAFVVSPSSTPDSDAEASENIYGLEYGHNHLHRTSKHTKAEVLAERSNSTKGLLKRISTEIKETVPEKVQHVRRKDKASWKQTGKEFAQQRWGSITDLVKLAKAGPDIELHRRKSRREACGSRSSELWSQVAQDGSDDGAATRNAALDQAREEVAKKASAERKAAERSTRNEALMDETSPRRTVITDRRRSVVSSLKSLFKLNQKAKQGPSTDQVSSKIPERAPRLSLQSQNDRGWPKMWNSDCNFAEGVLASRQHPRTRETDPSMLTKATPRPDSRNAEGTKEKSFIVYKSSTRTTAFHSHPPQRRKTNPSRLARMMRNPFSDNDEEEDVIPAYQPSTEHPDLRKGSAESPVIISPSPEIRSLKSLTLATTEAYDADHISIASAREGPAPQNVSFGYTTPSASREMLFVGKGRQFTREGEKIIRRVDKGEDLRKDSKLDEQAVKTAAAGDGNVLAAELGLWEF